MTRAEQLQAALVQKGIDQHDNELRHMIHEAAHALRWKVQPPWTNEAVAEGAPSRAAFKFREEVIARAAEERICALLGVEIDSRERRIAIAAMEGIKHDDYRVPGGLDTWLEAVEHAMTSEEVNEVVDRILALAPEQVQELA